MVRDNNEESILRIYKDQLWHKRTHENRTMRIDPRVVRYRHEFCVFRRYKKKILYNIVLYHNRFKDLDLRS